MKLRNYLHAFGIPLIMLILILLTEVLEHTVHLPFHLHFILFLIAGGYVCFDTLVTIWRSKKITAGILVVLALIGCAYTGDYHEGAEVSFMMILGEALEHFAVEKTKLTVNLMAHPIDTCCHGCSGVHTGDGTHAGRLADRFSAGFLPIVLCIGILVWFLTKDIRRVMTIFVIACPCSLMLSSPIAVLTCIGNASKNGILLTGGEMVEQCGSIKSTTFDQEKNLYIADNGLTLGATTDADVIFTKDSAQALPYALALTKKSCRIIWQNIFVFAFAVNLTGILLSSLGLLNPVLAALVHNISSLCVVLNSLRLLKFSKKECVR